MRRRELATNLFKVLFFVPLGPSLAVSGMLKEEEEDDLERKALFQDAANGKGFAQWELGYCFRNGFGGIRKNLEQAAYWFRKSVESGFSFGHRDLVELLLDKEFPGAKTTAGFKNLERAADLLKKGAEQGDSSAQWALAALLLDEKFQGTKTEEGLHWLERAATQGDSEAQLKKGVMMAFGQVEGSDVEALKLLILGVDDDLKKLKDFGQDDLGDPPPKVEAQAFALLKGRMSSEEVAEAFFEAVDWEAEYEDEDED